MALLLAIGPRLLPEYKDPDPGRLDLPSLALSLVAVLAVIYGIKSVANDGIALASVAPVLAGLVVGAAFVDRQRRLADPMIDLGLFRRPAFSLALVANTLPSRSCSGSRCSWRRTSSSCSVTRRSRRGCGAFPARPRSS
jgi:DHA2 family multidrug resistance protein-like MFS transporter